MRAILRASTLTRTTSPKALPMLMVAAARSSWRSTPTRRRPTRGRGAAHWTRRSTWAWTPSSWPTPASCNTRCRTTPGVCAPPKAVRWVETPQGRESRLNGALIDRYAPGENAGYPTLCKGRFDVGDDENYYAIEEPTSLNTLELLPQLLKMGVRAIKIE